MCRQTWIHMPETRRGKTLSGQLSIRIKQKLKVGKKCRFDLDAMFGKQHVFLHLTLAAPRHPPDLLVQYHPNASRR